MVPSYLDSTTRCTRFLEPLHFETILLSYTCRINERDTHPKGKQSVFRSHHAQCTPSHHLRIMRSLRSTIVCNCAKSVGLPASPSVVEQKPTHIVPFDHSHARLLALVTLANLNVTLFMEEKKTEKREFYKNIAVYRKSRDQMFSAPFVTSISIYRSSLRLSSST